MDAAPGTPRRRRAGVAVRRRGEGARLRRVLRVLAAAIAVLLPAAAWGISTASVEASLGPHVARYEVTVDGTVTVDLGPLGSVVMDSPAPVLGGRVVVQEIPREVTAVDPAETLAALGQDLRSYVQFFSSPQEAVDVAIRALVRDALTRTLVAALVLGAAVFAIRALLGPHRRAELVAALRPRVGLVAAGTAAVVLLASVSASDVRPGTQGPSGTASRVFDGTPLEGARITGRLAGVIDTYGGYVVDAYEENERFYAGAVTGLRDAWERRAATDALREATALGPRVPEPKPTPDGTTDPDPTPTVTPTPTPEPTEGPEPVVVLLVSDLHCNAGMARVVAAAAELSGADLLANAGDSTVNGTAVEQYCVSAFASAVPPGATMVVADGNHDSAETADQERRAGMVVLDGDVVEVAGLRVLGDADPRATRVGAGTTAVGDETLADVGRRLADVACSEGEPVDLLLAHNPVVGTQALEEGCARAQLSGHVHRAVGPVRVGEGLRYVSASTAGAALGQATIGPLRGVAEMTVLRWDPAERRFLDQRVIRVEPDGSVQVGTAVAWPDGPAVRERAGDPR